MRTKNLKSLAIDDADAGEVSAVFATLNVVDSHGDVTRSGAFASEDVRISAYGHESWYGQLPVGRGSIREQGDEAIFTGKFFMETTAGRDTFHVVKAMGELQEWSYGFDVIEAAHGEIDGKSVQFLDKLKVHEVSPVLIGAGVNTRTLGVKSDGMKLSEQATAVVAAADDLLTRVGSVMALRAEKGKTGIGSDAAAALVKLEDTLTTLGELVAKASESSDEQDPELADALAAEMLRIERDRLAQLTGASE